MAEKQDAMQAFNTILLAYDGSERGRVALRRALPLLRPVGVQVHLLAVVPLAPPLPASIPLRLSPKAKPQ